MTLNGQNAYALTTNHNAINSLRAQRSAHVSYLHNSPERDKSNEGKIYVWILHGYDVHRRLPHPSTSVH